jgi:spore germination protein KB
MLEKGVISLSQFFILILMFVIGTSILLDPAYMVVAAKQDAWIGCLLGIGIGSLLTFLYVVLAKQHPNKTLIEFNEIILGKWLGKGISFLFFIYFLLLTAGLTRIIGDFLTTYIMPETPILAVEILFIITVIFGVRLGLEPFTRTSELILPYVILFYILLVIFLFPEIKIENLVPIMEGGIKPIIKAGILSLGVPFADIIIFLMITPYIENPSKIGKALFWGVIIGGLIILTFVLLSILVLGTNQTAQSNYPIYSLSQKVNIGDFIQRIEVLAGGMIFISLFIKTMICFYSTTLGFAQLLKLKRFKMLTFPFGIIILLLSNIMSPNIIFFHSFLAKTWPFCSIIFGVFLPLLLLVVDRIRSGNKKSQLKISEGR